LKILIVKLSALGDVIHTLPVLTTLRRAQPEAHLAWLIEETFADLVRGHAALDRLIVWPRRTWTRLARSGRLVSLVRSVRAFGRELRDTRYDRVLDCQGSVKGALWISRVRADRKTGYGPGIRHSEGSWWVLDERVPVVPEGTHALDRSLRLLEAVGLPRLPLRYDVPIGPDHEREAAELLGAAGLAGAQPFIAIHPMTRWRTKNWAPDRFARTADALVARGWPVLWTGGAADRPALDAIAARMREPSARLDGRTSVMTLAALLRRARVVLCTDTGPMHLAAAVGTPVVALFGPTSPAATGPYGDAHVVLRAGVECSPCFKRHCHTRRYEKHACMLRLDVGQVVDAVIGQAARGGASLGTEH
jgi:lipopolysaccharide heptosyltransferase I